MLIVVALPGLLVLVLLCLRLKAFPARLIPFWICGVALYFSEWQRPDIYHLLFGCPVILLTLFALFHMLQPPSWAGKLVLVSVALFGFSHMLMFLFSNQKIETRRGTIYSQRQDLSPQLVQRYARPGEDVFVYPNLPLLNFLSATRNPTRFSYLIYGWQTPLQFEEAVRDLESKRVRYVFLETDLAVSNMQIVLPYYHTPPPAEQIMERYLEAHYREIDSEGGYRILQRVQD
jgi:hypothetical protein